MLDMLEKMVQKLRELKGRSVSVCQNGCCEMPSVVIDDFEYYMATRDGKDMLEIITEDDGRLRIEIDEVDKVECDGIDEALRISFKNKMNLQFCDLKCA